MDEKRAEIISAKCINVNNSLFQNQDKIKCNQDKIKV